MLFFAIFEVWIVYTNLKPWIRFVLDFSVFGVIIYLLAINQKWEEIVLVTFAFGILYANRHPDKRWVGLLMGEDTALYGFTDISGILRASRQLENQLTRMLMDEEIDL